MACNKCIGANGYFKRFFCALPVVAALVLTFLFFSPLETVIANSNSFQYSAWQAVPVMGGMSLALILLGTALLAAFRGKLYNVFLTVCLSIALCIYIQTTFLAGSTPQLSGDDVNWAKMKRPMLVNTAIWIVVFCTPVIMLQFKKIWKYAAVLIPVMICVMQLTGILSLSMGSDGIFGKVGFLNYDHFCDYSDQQNVLVFMLDRFDYDYIEGVEKENPEFFERLDGFTRYDNAISQFAHTRPAMNFMLTNYDATMFREDADSFFRNSWDDGERHILQDLKKAGYCVNLYGYPRSLLGTDYGSFTDCIDNLDISMNNIDQERLFKTMTLMSAYRCLPMAMKPFFYQDTSIFNKVFKANTSYEVDETIYDSRMDKMTVSSGTGYFKFYEFVGSHSPYRLDKNGKISDDKTSAVEQTMGCFEILLRAFDKMKAEGIYKDTAIIILADHAAMGNDYKELEKPARIGMFYKPAGVEGSPLFRSNAPVSLRNIPATILKSAGLDYSAYGVPLDEVADDESIVRDYCRTIADKDRGWEDYYALYYDVQYDASDMDSWQLKRTEIIEYPLGF